MEDAGKTEIFNFVFTSAFKTITMTNTVGIKDRGEYKQPRAIKQVTALLRNIFILYYIIYYITLFYITIIIFILLIFILIYYSSNKYCFIYYLLIYLLLWR